MPPRLSRASAPGIAPSKSLGVVLWSRFQEQEQAQFSRSQPGYAWRRRRRCRKIFSFRYDNDERGNVEGKRASCEVYSKIAQVQVDANRKYNCGYNGPRWDHDLEQHFHWCRHVRREEVVTAVRERAGELQRCFDRLGDFDEEDTGYRR